MKARLCYCFEGSQYIQVQLEKREIGCTGLTFPRVRCEAVVLHLQVKQNKRDLVLDPYKSNNNYGNQTKGNKFSVLNKSVKQLQIFLQRELLISQRKTSNTSSLEPANSSWKKK